MPRIKVNIEFTTTKDWGTISATLGVLDPEDITITTSTINGDVKRGPYKKKYVASTKADKAFVVPLNRLSRPRRYTDQRIVWNSFKGNVNIAASLKMLGMTRQQLADMRTKTGTAEYIVKQAAARQRTPGQNL